MRWYGHILLLYVTWALAGCVAASRHAEPRARDRMAAERLNEEGLQLIAESRLEDAERQFRMAIEADPFLGTAHCNLGVCLLQQAKEPFEAAWAFQHASSLMPKAVQPRLGLAQLYEKAGQYGTAEEGLRDALRLHPDDIEVIGQLARLHVRQNKVTPETQGWLKSLTLSGLNEDWRNWAQKQLARSGSSELDMQGVYP